MSHRDLTKFRILHPEKINLAFKLRCCVEEILESQGLDCREAEARTQDYLEDHEGHIYEAVEQAVNDYLETHPPEGNEE